MSNFGYDYPIFNWFHSSDPLGTILDCPDLGENQILEWDLTEDSLIDPLNFQQMIEQLQYPAPPLHVVPPQVPSQNFPYISTTPLQLSPPSFDLPLSPTPNTPTSPPLSPNSITSVQPFPIYNPEEIYDDDHSSEENELFEKELSKVKLQASKSPIMDALVYCALNRWGIELLEENGDNIRFRVLNFQKYYKYSGIICAKQNPTEDIASRIKALKRWFPDFPTKRAGNLEDAFEITVQLPNKQDNKPQKLHEIIEKQRKLLGVQKICRQG